MRPPTRDLLARLGARELRLEKIQHGPGLVELRMHCLATQRIGFPVCAYLVDEVLVDTGFAHVRPLLLEALEGRSLRAVALTHHHEDHAGNAGVVAARHGCPVLLHQPGERWGENVGTLGRYRRLFYGWTAPYEPEPMPATIHTGARSLRVVPAEGHSQTHVALFEPEVGLLFTGDLWVSRGASAVMRHEDPHQLLASLRTVEALGATRMFTGHGGAVDAPGPILARKIERLELAIEQVLRLHDQGAGTHSIRRQVFPRGALGELGFVLLTDGEFSHANFVRAVIAHRPRERGAP